MKTLRLRISSDTSTALGSEHFDKWDTVSRMPLKLNKIIDIAGVLVGALLNPKFIKILKTNHVRRAVRDCFAFFSSAASDERAWTLLRNAKPLALAHALAHAHVHAQAASTIAEC